MNVLMISTNGLANNVALLIKNEGHYIKLYIKDKSCRGCFDNMVEKTTNWRKELKWVGKEGLIIFDDVGFGRIQDNLRKKGYKVFGGCEIGDKLEVDREFGQKIMKEYGLKTVPLKDFNDFEEAVLYIKKHPAPWVIKQNDHGNKFLSYIGHFSDGRDVISVLKNYLQNKNLNREKITLHKRIDGIEIGVGRYFNGFDWVGPIEMNIEHTKFFPGDLGPTTSEMGTVAWYESDESNKLFCDVLKPFKSYLQKIGFHGDFEINCIVNETGAYPLEFTTRLGSPIIHLQSELHNFKWAGFLKAVANGNEYDLEYKKGYGVVLLLAVPPFPYSKKLRSSIFYGINIYTNQLSKEEHAHVHYEEIAMRAGGKYDGQLYIADEQGYVGYVTSVDSDLCKAREKAVSIARKMIIPKVFFREDIGCRFENEEIQWLRDWGYLK